MKTFFLLLMLILAWLASDDVFIVTLGKAPDCNGYNFCGIRLKTETSLKTENEIITRIMAVDEHHICFSFLKNSINDRMFLKYFATGVFILDDDFMLSNELCQFLHLSHCQLKQGRYEIEEAYDKYVVRFNY